MNPNNTIKPWLLLCSKQGGFGATEAHETVAPDMSGKPTVIYFVYHAEGMKPSPGCLPITKNTLPDPEGYDVVVSASQQWETTVTIEIVNSQNGMSELAACALAAEKDQDVLNLLSRRGVAVVTGSAEIENNTTRDGDRFYYRHEMKIKFKTTEKFTHTKTNHRVEEVVLADNAFDIEGA